jgi:hypothetical protein
MGSAIRPDCPKHYTEHYTEHNGSVAVANPYPREKSSPMLRLWLVVVTLLLGLSGCIIPTQLETDRSEAFRQYEIIVRWSQWDAAADFISPEYLAENPITRLQMERLRLFRVTQYIIRSVNVIEDGLAAIQVVEIKLFNTNQGVERTIIDEQVWRWDESSKRWRLHSPLPDPTQGR